MNGPNSGGGYWSRYLARKDFDEDNLHLPKATPVPGRNIDMLYEIVGE